MENIRLHFNLIFAGVEFDDYYMLKANHAKINVIVFVEFRLNKASCKADEIESM